MQAMSSNSAIATSPSFGTIPTILTQLDGQSDRILLKNSVLSETTSLSKLYARDLLPEASVEDGERTHPMSERYDATVKFLQSVFNLMIEYLSDQFQVRERGGGLGQLPVSTSPSMTELGAGLPLGVGVAAPPPTPHRKMSDATEEMASIAVSGSGSAATNASAGVTATNGSGVGAAELASRLQTSPLKRNRVNSSGLTSPNKRVVLRISTALGIAIGKVLDFTDPSDLRALLEDQLRLQQPQPVDLKTLNEDLRQVLRHCVRIGHPHFLNQLSNGLDIISMAGEWLTAAVNTNMFTYEVAPVFTLIEETVLERMRLMIGWPAETGDGIFAPGGSISNMYSVLVARQKRFPEARRFGMQRLPPVRVFVSKEAHYSIDRATIISGIGLDNLVGVECDSSGRMDPRALEAELERCVSEGACPLLVCATAGTTVRGAFDPIEAIAALCSRFGVWFHVDAAWGGGVIFSQKHKHLLKGIEKADSVTWNPHKIMVATLQCSAFLVKQKGLLQECNGLCASYLFQSDKHYDTSYDTGDKTIQCGRRNDVFKLWLAWRARGDAGFVEHVDRMFDLAAHFTERCRHTDGFELLWEPQYVSVCFMYVPRSLRGASAEERQSNGWMERVNAVAPELKSRMMREGSLMISYQPLNENPNFWRVVFSNPATQQEDVDFIFSEMERLGANI